MMQLLTHIVRFILMAVLQIVLFSHFQILGYATPFLFLFFILFLPVNLPRWQVILLSFILGFIIDYFAGTYGLYAAGAGFVGLLRIQFLRWVVHNFQEDEDEVFHFSELSVLQFTGYTLLASFVFSMVFFVFDYFTFSAILRIGLHIILSTLSTFVCIFIYRYLFANFR